MLPILLPLMVMTSPDPSELAMAARAAFADKCIQCHGPELSHPKSGFGFVTDLSRLAATPEYIVPGQPDKSRLWKEIDDGDMPPDNAKAGPLTDPQRAAILDWIKAGAPSGAGDEPRALPAPARDDQPGAGARALRLLGHLHVLVVHFPIGLLLTASTLELAAALMGRPALAPIVRGCVRLGAIAALAAAGMGWVLALGRSEPLFSTLWVHRWLGTGAAAAAALVLALIHRASDRASPPPGLRAAVILLGGLVGAAAHFGGMLVYGAEFLKP
jgi:uncharacterized membrane protein